MNKILLIFLLLLTSCSSSKNISDKTIKDFEFSKEMSFDEFKVKLEEYAKINPYPNIDD